MNGYFSRLMQQTGISVDGQGSKKAYQPNPGKNRLAELHDHPERPESLKVEEIIEVTAPTGSAATDYDEISIAGRNQNNVSEDTRRPVKQEPSNLLKHRYQSHVKTSHQDSLLKTNQGIKPSTPIQSGRKSDKDESKNNETEPLPATNSSEFTTVFVNKPISLKESKPLTLQSEIEHSEVSERVNSPSPASIEQHVYISQLPDAYQQAIKEWLTSPADGGKNQPGNREKLKKVIKSKQNSKVTLESEQMKGDDHSFVQVGNEQFKTRDLHLSVGNINLTMEEPETIKQYVPQASNKPTRRQSTGSSRLSRHYVRVR